MEIKDRSVAGCPRGLTCVNDALPPPITLCARSRR